MDISADMTLLDARTIYFETNGFGDDGGYGKPTVTIELGPLKMSLPNMPARVRAVRYHDLHHVLTGYRTNMAGEVEISAWELGSGCKRERAAWVLNLLALMYGICFHPRATARAWARGRQTQNLYGRDFAPLLEREVADMRAQLGLDRRTPMRAGDLLSFVALALALLPLIPLAAVLTGIVGLIMWLVYRA